MSILRIKQSFYNLAKFDCVELEKPKEDAEVCNLSFYQDGHIIYQELIDIDQTEEVLKQIKFCYADLIGRG